METTSASLLEKLKQPQAEAAWSRFVQLYTPLFFYWARRLGLQEQDAADMVQDVFTVLVRTMPAFRYDQSRSFRGWLRTVFHNKWRERNRHAQRPAVMGGSAADKIPCPDDDVLALSEAEFQQQLTVRALELMQAEFQPTTWRACWEHVVCGREPTEVAAELGITVNAVYLAKSRVLRRLRQELAGMLE
jgi:RNA polymerase sigma-70 factor (ECF subfamily)